METIRELYRIGLGPSSSHTMAPRRAAEIFFQNNPGASAYRVTLFGSLAATGRGHLTDRALQSVFAPLKLDIIWRPDVQLPMHPNGMRFETLDANGHPQVSWEVYSMGGGALSCDAIDKVTCVYDVGNMTAILKYLKTTGLSFWEYVEQREGPEIWDFLAKIWEAMQASIERGLHTEGVLPDGLGLRRKAVSFFRQSTQTGPQFSTPGFLSAYALAVAEENASGGVIVTAPTCGSAGVLPSTLRFTQEMTRCDDRAILHALATAGLIGNLIKHNASISGAEVGCQGEIGAACAMAAGAAAQLLGGAPRQVEYAAEMGLEHHLGLTCDPVRGLVQIPCIERNAFAATRALNCAEYALFSDGSHRISFDGVVTAMRQTGHDMPTLYRETGEGGLAAIGE